MKWDVISVHEAFLKRASRGLKDLYLNLFVMTRTYMHQAIGIRPVIAQAKNRKALTMSRIIY